MAASGQNSPPGSAPAKYTPIAAPGSLFANPGSTAPAPYGQFGNIAQVNPTYAQSYNANPFQQQKYLQQYDQMYAKGLQPTFNQQDLSLSQDLASRGISDSSAANYNMGQLYAQQGGQVAQGEAPMVQQAFGYTQQDIMANQAAQNAAASQNAQASNAASDLNAQYYTGAVNQNAGLYNQYQQSLFGAGVNQQNALMSAYLNSFGPNTGVTNAFGQEMSGVGNTYADIYGSALQGEGSTMGGIGQGLGTYFGDQQAAAAGAGG